MSAPISSINALFDWVMTSLDTNLFGAVGIACLMFLAIIFGLLVFMNANRFALFGFMSVTLLAFGVYGYTFFGWIAPLGALLAGLLLGLAIIRLIGA